MTHDATAGYRWSVDPIQPTGPYWKDYTLTARPLSVGNETTPLKRTLRQTISLEITERLTRYRFGLLDDLKETPMMTRITCLGRQGSLRFYLFTCDSDESIKNTSNLTFASDIENMDFIVVGHRKNIVKERLYNVIFHNAIVENNPNDAYYIMGLSIYTLYTKRDEFRKYLTDPGHIFAMVNPLLPWYRREWLRWLFDLPRDFTGTYSYEQSGDPNVKRIPAHGPEIRRSERIQQRQLR